MTSKTDHPFRPPSAADYAATVIAPILIAGMITAIGAYLLMVTYRGGYPARLIWILSMFSLGATGIARVSIERDRSYSLGYAAVLGLVTFLAMAKYVGGVALVPPILVLVALLADWIVRDCTLIDETVDSSDRGLLDAVSADHDQDKTPAVQHGRSVLWLSAFTLPAFAIGQLFLPAGQAAGDRAEFYAMVYLSCALSLLVTTSFLGLRRYLRQRDTAMPADVSVGWLGGGIIVVLLVLMLASFAPIPGKLIASFESPFTLEGRDDVQSNRGGWGRESGDRAGEGTPPPSSEPANAPEDASEKEVGSVTQGEEAEAGDVGDGDREDGPTGQSEGESDQASEAGKADAAGEKDSNVESESGSESESASESDDSGDQNGSERNPDAPDNRRPESSRPPPGASPPPDVSPPSLPFDVGTIVRGLVLLACLLTLAWFAYAHWHRIVAWMASRTDADSPSPTKAALTADPPPPPLPFAAYQNPIGAENDPAKVVTMTFAALQAWARERGVERPRDQTASEFEARLRKADPSVARTARGVIAAYNRIVYGRGRGQSSDVDAAAALWRVMSKKPPPLA